MTRYCPCCCRELPLDAFGFHRLGPDGRKSHCRSCIASTRRKRPLPAPGTKRCSRCEKDLDLTCFGKHVGKKDGLESWCRTCINEVKARRAGPRKKPVMDPADRARRERWARRAAELDRKADLVSLGMGDDVDEDQLGLDYGDVV